MVVVVVSFLARRVSSILNLIPFLFFRIRGYGKDATISRTRICRGGIVDKTFRWVEVFANWINGGYLNREWWMRAWLL